MFQKPQEESIAKCTGSNKRVQGIFIYLTLFYFVCLSCLKLDGPILYVLNAINLFTCVEVLFYIIVPFKQYFKCERFTIGAYDNKNLFM